MMTSIRSWLRGLYPGACSLKKSKDEEAGAQRNSGKHQQLATKRDGWAAKAKQRFKGSIEKKKKKE